MKKRITIVLLVFVFICTSLTGCLTMTIKAPSKNQIETFYVDVEITAPPFAEYVTEDTDTFVEESEEGSDVLEEGNIQDSVGPVVGTTNGSFDISQVAQYNGIPFVAINGNVPYFTEEEMTTTSYENYAELDLLGRCGVTISCIGKDIMPTEERGEIGSVKPTGWHTVKYDCVDGKYLYNRCHLIGFQLTGENANTANLITGTRYMNVYGMLPFENMVADYVKETGNHVMYRVTPIFEGDNLVATGVLMEAKSVEDNGEGILFCVFCYNVQPGVVIDYATGESTLDEVVEAPTEEGALYIKY